MISESTIHKLTTKLRDKFSSYINQNPIILGGNAVLIQIDESKFNLNVKSHRGHAPAQAVWVFGIVDTRFQPARGYMEVVERRDAATLTRLIREHVLVGSNFHSDEWAAYNGLADMGYSHSTVCHKYEYINSSTGAHTQHVESYWNKKKLRIKARKGCCGSVLQKVLNEFIFFDFFSENVYEAIVIHCLQ